ncbi:MAG: HAD-IA family hydrolase [Mariprofundales bacterium]|nr:HAD-IA family hydrolase [Mariprofundales bacterium]
MKSLQCVLFDVDGTLADTERDGHRVAFNMAFEAAGLVRRWGVATYGELLAVTGGKERIRRDISLGKMPGMDDDQIAELHAAKTVFYQQLIADGAIPLRPGVMRLLEECYAAGITLGISTTTTPAALDALIRHVMGAEWFDRFAVLAAGDIVPAKKPAPDIYNYAIGRLGVDPQTTLAVEDSANGLRSAQTAGLACLVTVNGYTRNHSFDGADLLLADLGEPDGEAVELLADPHHLNPFHHVDLALLQRLMKGNNSAPYQKTAVTAQIASEFSDSKAKKRSLLL